MSQTQERNIKLEPGYWWFRFRLWRRESAEKLRWKVAWAVPRSIALLCFVRVSASTGECPGLEYRAAYDAWEKGAGR